MTLSLDRTGEVSFFDFIDQERASTIFMALKANSFPLFILFGSDLSLACSTVWVVRTPHIDYEDLNDNAKSFVKKIEEISGVPVIMISTGPKREDTIIRKDI